MKGSPAGFDVVQPVEFDVNGRLSKSYLPYVASTMSGSYQTDVIAAQADFYNNSADKIADDASPYAQSVFESSPIGRIKEQGGIGSAWQPGTSHTKRITYTYNDADEVRSFNIDGTSTVFYPANTLSKQIVKDEDGSQTIVFNDLRGRTLLKKQQLDEVIDGVNVPYLETYFIYDDFDRLKYTISPKGVAAMQTNGWSFTTTIQNSYTYQFVYDSRGRLTEKKIPGQQWMFYCYDNLNRLVLVQDSLLRSQNKWMFIKYDRKDRAVMQGLYKNGVQTTRASVQDLLNGLYSVGNAEYQETDKYERKGTSLEGYNNVSFPKINADGTAVELWAVMYYDNHDFDFDGIQDYTYTPQGITGEGTPGKSTGLLTGGKRIVLGTSTWLSTYIFYDEYHRPIQVRSNNHKSTAIDNLATTVYDFEGKILTTRNYHNAGPGRVTTVINRFNYDAKGRLLEIYQNNNNAASDQLVVQYEYNELGQIVDKKLHHTSGSAFLQSVDLRYNIKGWLTSINNAQLAGNGANNEDADAMAQDYFGMEFLYNEAEGGLNNLSRFNGNISAIKWKGIGTLTGTENQSSYTYLYDKANKLKSATSQMFDGTTWAKEAGALNESMTYDQNGNIKTLQRNDRQHQLDGVIASYISQMCDDLMYTYSTLIGDRLLKVVDNANGSLASSGFTNGASGTNDDYTYDGHGNITSDQNKGITEIQYNVLGKVSRIAFTDGGEITYSYDAAGTKLAMTVCQTGAGCTTTEYVGGFVYENDVLSFFGSREGRVVNKNNNLEYQYTIADNQGNTRVVFSAENPGPDQPLASFEGDLNDETDQYLNVDPNFIETFFGANHTPSGSKVIKMNQDYRIGPSKSVKVYPGDKVDMEVWEYHEGSSGFGSSSTAAAVLIDMVSLAFGGSSSGMGEAGAIYSGVEDAITVFGAGGNQGTTRPAAYLNFILFDKHYNVLNAGFQLVPDVTFTKQKISFPTLEIEAEGYVFVYLSYDNDSPNPVFFDDFRVTHTKTNVIQYNEYYPYGLQTSNSWTRDASRNNFLYNGSTELNPTSGYYDLFYRNYDAAIGRFIQVDPKAANQMATYQYAGSNPIMFNDPMGDIKVKKQPIYPTHSSGFGEFALAFIQNRKYFQSGGKMGGGTGGGGGGGGGGSGYGWSGGLYENQLSDYLFMGTRAFYDKYGITSRQYHAGMVAAYSNWGDPTGSTEYANGAFVENPFGSWVLLNGTWIEITSAAQMDNRQKWMGEAQQGYREFPAFSTLWSNYPHSTENSDGTYNHAHPSVDNYANQCAIRVSFTLILSGADLDTYPAINKTTDGYARSAKNLADWLWVTYGPPKILTQEAFHESYLNSTGIIYEAPIGRGYAPHIDLWNQGDTGSGYYESPEIWFWDIK